MRTLLPEPVRRSAAYHEAGHTIAHLKFNVPFEYVTIKPDVFGEYNGCVYSKSMIINSNHAVIINLAGAFAERRGCGGSPCWLAEHAETDYLAADKIINGSCHIGNIEAWNMMEENTRAFINDNWHPIDVLAGALLKLDRIIYDDVIRILNVQCPEWK